MLSLIQFLNKIDEEDGGVPANNVGSGNVKGIAPGESPPVNRKMKKVLNKNIFKRFLGKK